MNCEEIHEIQQKSSRSLYHIIFSSLFDGSDFSWSVVIIMKPVKIYERVRLLPQLMENWFLPYSRSPDRGLPVSGADDQTGELAAGEEEAAAPEKSTEEENDKDAEGNNEDDENMEDDMENMDERDREQAGQEEPQGQR